MRDKDCEFVFQTVQVNEVEALLRSVNGEKPSGLDNLDGKLLGMVSGSVALPICHIFNLSLLKGVCPTAWKAAKVIPLPKNKKDMFSGANSRPISILPVLSKLMEKVVFDQISLYFSFNKLNSEFQHAYKKDHSTSTALMQMTDQWMSDIDRKMIVVAVLLDFSAAFDLIDHNMLLMKLAAYGFKNLTLNWMRSYLSIRTQTVYFNGSLSTVRAVQCGVLQGSCLGPLLYSIFANDMPLVLSKASVAMFADDSTVYMSSYNMDDLNLLLKNDLDLILEWVTKNKLILNVEKIKCIIFGSNQALRRQNQLKISIKGSCIEQVTEAKLLGILLDEHLSWQNHIDKLTGKMGKVISMIRKHSSLLTPLTRLLFKP